MPTFYFLQQTIAKSELGRKKVQLKPGRGLVDWIKYRKFKTI
jgi:hypothetical protein